MYFGDSLDSEYSYDNCSLVQSHAKSQLRDLTLSPEYSTHRWQHDNLKDCRW
jgi:hypothetical protein